MIWTMFLLMLLTTVPESRWVDIVNPGIPRDQVCVIEMSMTIVVRAEHKDTYLVEVREDLGGKGTRCDRGVLFFISKRDFDTFQARYDALLQQEQAQRDLVRQLLQRQNP